MPIIDGPPGTNDELIAPVLAAKEALSSLRTRQLSAMHYGWCPYDDIQLMGPTGLEKRVGYNERGEFATVLKRGQLLIFQNVDIRQLSATDNNIPNGPPPQLVDVVKYAATCAGEIQDAYGDWGFMLLMELVGMEPMEAFEIFKTIQPAVYKLATLEDELIYDAPQRILEAFGDGGRGGKRTIEFAGIAERTRAEMLIGARRAITKAENLIGELNKDMAAFVGTKQGKSMAFPGDLHALDQLDMQAPARITPRSDAGLDDIKSLLMRMAERDLQRGERDAPQLSAQDEAQGAQLLTALAALEKMEARQAQMEKEMKLLKRAQPKAN